jgi:hypothetical protein
MTNDYRFCTANLLNLSKDCSMMKPFQGINDNIPKEAIHGHSHLLEQRY